MLATRVRPISPSTAARHALATDEQLVSSIRGNDPAAFEALYERHQRELLSFCLYMLGSRADAEEALQVTFASAYRALLADERPVVLRPWLFAIARNQSLSILRRRRPTVELGGEAATGHDPVASGDLFREFELREEIRHTLAGVRELPEGQRAAMVLAELHGLSQSEIGSVMGLRPEQVKALVYQARSSLISERTARDADCREIRDELDTARGAALLKGKLRKHVRACPDCRTYADGMSRRRRGVGAFLPLLPWLTLKLRTLQDALSSAPTEQLTYAGGTTLGGTVAGAALVAGGPIKAIAVKVAAGAALLGLSTGLGAPVLSTPSVQHHAGSTVSLVGKPAWLPLLGEGEDEGGGSGHHGGAIGGGSSSGGAVPGGQPPGAGGQPPLGGIEGGAGGSGGYGGGGGAGGSSGSADGSGQHGGGGAAAHHAAGTTAAGIVGAGAGGAATQRQHAARQHGGRSAEAAGAAGSGSSGGSGISGESGQGGESGHSSGRGHSPGEGRTPLPKNVTQAATVKTGRRTRRRRRHPDAEAEQSPARTGEGRRTGRPRGSTQGPRTGTQAAGARTRRPAARPRTRTAKHESEHARTVAQHEREREQSKKQGESRKLREQKQHERQKNKRLKSRNVRGAGQDFTERRRGTRGPAHCAAG